MAIWTIIFSKFPLCFRGVHKAVAEFFRWNYEILEAGFLPERGFYNEVWNCSIRRQMAEKKTRLLGIYRASFGGWKGDLKARVECHCLRSSYAATQMCDACLALQPFPGAYMDPRRRPFLYTDFRPEAMWRSTGGRGEGMRASPWRVVPGFHEELVHFDVMHIAPIGVWRNLAAAVVVDKLRRGELRFVGDARALADLRLQTDSFSSGRCTPSKRIIRAAGREPARGKNKISARGRAEFSP
jgi:hypothetical protein